MRLERIKIRNFRLLRRFSVDLAPGKSPTIFVGPNNSGKTSVIDALRRFINDNHGGNQITINDLSQARHKDFSWLENKISRDVTDDEKTEAIRRYSPRITMDLTFSYDDTDDPDVNAASSLMVFLDPSLTTVSLRIQYVLENSGALLSDFESRRDKSITLITFLKADLTKYYVRRYYKVSNEGSNATELKDGGIVKLLLQLDVVSAQRHIDDDEGEQATKISRLLHDHYTNFYRIDNEDGYFAIEDALKDSAAELTDLYKRAFSRLIERLKGYGYPQGQKPPDLRIRAELSSETIYKDNARIYYSTEYPIDADTTGRYELPEKYNGLGFKNLIYIVLQLESFRAALDATLERRPRIHVIAIEEPEAHLHPQMQCAFIAEISRAVESDSGVTPQILLSTHSSHIIANSGFEPVRYFRRKRREVSVRDLSKLSLATNDGSLLEFLRRYVKSTHCDLFFADKAIFVEGQVERLLIPLMIEQQEATNAKVNLSRQYISVSEVGGAYAHKFKPIIKFLGIPTLVITDLDSVGANKEKCPVSTGLKTSNACLRTWLPKKEEIQELLACTEADKVEDGIRVAYQVQEQGQCGRSFEEAFIYANLAWLEEKAGDLSTCSTIVSKAVAAGLVAEAWKLSGDLDKSDFALDLMMLTGWIAPLYIREGLDWLAKQEDTP